MRFTVLIRVLPLALAILAFPLSAQHIPWSSAPPGDSLVPMTIVLVDNRSPTGLLRRTSLDPRNVILLDSATVTAQLLSDAVFSMLIMEAVDAGGQRRGNNEVQRANLSAAHPVYPWAEDALSRLLQSPKEPIRGVGRHRSLTIWMPRLRGRQP
ncbi:MAG TPA: hypothetical protein VF006_25230 [Longimicrobium sp.]